MESKDIPPHLYSALLNALTATAVKYKDTQQLRAQLGKTLQDHNVKPGHKQ